MLNASINLRKPDEDKSLMFKGARFEIHFEKTRGKTQQPFLVSLPEETVPEAGLSAGVWIVEEIGESLPKPSPTEELFLDAIHDGFNTLPTIAFEIGKSKDSVKGLGKRLKKKGLVTADKDGVYSLVTAFDTRHVKVDTNDTIDTADTRQKKGGVKNDWHQ